jgi:hypothetical protein
MILGIIKIKAYLKTTLVYHGDELENLWLIPSDSNIQTNDKLSIYMKKQLIFEDEYVEKKFFRHSFANFSH